MKTENDVEFNLLYNVAKKSGWLSALMNLFLPGMGYAYCGRWILGIITFIIVMTLTAISFGSLYLLFIFIMFIDGFLCARRYNKKLLEQMIQARRG